MKPSLFVLGLLGVATLSATALATDHTTRPPNYFAGPADFSRLTVLRNVRLDSARAFESIALRDLRDTQLAEEDEELEHPVMKRPRTGVRARQIDPVAQHAAPIVEMPMATVNFAGQGNSTTKAVVTGTPPDTNGAVGLSHYVQTVNGGIAVYSKTGTLIGAAKHVNALWTGYTGTHAGNGCAANNDGDPVVLYDQLADRWFVTQFSLPNANSAGGPSFQCVAVSKTGDPSGAYFLYDFQYPYSINDYGKFGVWPDAYLANFNGFDGNSYTADDMCAYDRASMLQGKTAEQQCFPNPNAYAALPVSVDGFVPPPRGTPGYFLDLGMDQQGNFNNTLELFSLHVDWTTPGNSKMTGPVVIPVAAFTDACGGGNNSQCIPQGGSNVKVSALNDRLMFRFNYRNFGTHESLVVNHGASTANGTAGVRWYEIRSPSKTPTIYQQGTYGPNDGNWRWGGSIAQDMAQGLGLGFSISSATQKPSIAWTGRLAKDALGQMAQGESQVVAGSATEANAQQVRWGDYSAMTVDPSDDCTFWYTTELYKTVGTSTWDTQIATFKFPNCGANDFTIALSSGVKNVKPGGTTNVTVTTTAAKGTAEPITLNVQDLPAGVTAAFNPPTVTAGATSTMTLTAAANAALVSATSFIVIGTADSALHKADGQVAIVNCSPKTCSAGVDCDNMDDGCGGKVDCGMCGTGKSCVANVCQAVGPDGGVLGDGGNGVDSGNGENPGSSGAASDASNSSGCGCRSAGAGGEPLAAFGAAGLVLALAARRARKSRRGSR